MTADINGKSGTLPDREPPTLQFLVLKWAVILMGVLLIAGFAIIIVTIVNRATGIGKNERQPAAITGFEDSGTAVEVPVARGADVTTLDLDGNRLAIMFKTPSGSEITIVHIKTGKILRQFKLKEK
ncbi:MAG: hypothetical protein ACR2OX_01170 [Methyloligellaceae bacterium]